MSALFTIFDPKGETFEVPAHKLAALKGAGWSTTPPVTDAKGKAHRKLSTASEDATAE